MATINLVDNVRATVNGKSRNNGHGEPNGQIRSNGRTLPIKPTYVRDVHPIDFPWQIEWNPETCILGQAHVSLLWRALGGHAARKVKNSTAATVRTYARFVFSGAFAVNRDGSSTVDVLH